MSPEVEHSQDQSLHITDDMSDGIITTSLSLLYHRNCCHCGVQAAPPERQMPADGECHTGWSMGGHTQRSSRIMPQTADPDDPDVSSFLCSALMLTVQKDACIADRVAPIAVFVFSALACCSNQAVEEQRVALIMGVQIVHMVLMSDQTKTVLGPGHDAAATPG